MAFAHLLLALTLGAAPAAAAPDAAVAGGESRSIAGSSYLRATSPSGRILRNAAA